MMTDVIESLTQHWDQIAGLLSPHDRGVVARLAGDLRDAPDLAARREVLLEIVEFVAPLLPADHPVRRALASESSKYAVTTADWGPPIDLLQARLAGFGLRSEWAADAEDAVGGAAGTEIPTAHDVGRQADEWLLAAPGVDAAEVRRRGVDPDGPGLIRIGPPGHNSRFPAFQFDTTGKPYAVVTQINLLLDADEDPWGVADWWLGPSAWLDAIPAEMIGRISDEVLLDAAAAVVEVA